jgi:5-methylcytosine-specific restriction endonuclease McrA
MQHHLSFAHLSDDQLTATLSRLALQERASTVELLACLAEFDHRRLYLGLGYTSIFAYAKDALHLADGAAYKRITVARASRRYPVVLDMLRDGRLSLSTACLVAVKLTPDTADALLSEATGKTKREVESILARRHPQPPVESTLRKLPDARAVIEAPATEPASATTALAATVPPTGFLEAPAPPLQVPQPASRRPVIAPLSETQYKLQVTISTTAHNRLRHIQDLLRHTIPNGDPALIIERALELLHEDLLKKKTALVARPRRTQKRLEAVPKGRVVPAAVKRQVWLRDGARCAFTTAEGRRCDERGGLEYHHVHPYAQGGRSTAENIELRCRAHNGFEWELFSRALTT